MRSPISRRQVLHSCGILTLGATAGCLRLQSGSESRSSEETNIYELTSKWKKDISIFLSADEDFFTWTETLTRIAPDGTTVFNSKEPPDSHRFNIIAGKQHALHVNESGVYVGASTDSEAGGRVYAFDPSTGEQRWMVEEPADGYHGIIRSPIRAGDSLLYTVYGGTNSQDYTAAVRAVDIQTGQREWDIEYDGFIDVQVFPVGGKLLVGTPYDGIMKYDLDTREKIDTWDSSLGLRDFRVQDEVLYTSIGTMDAISIASGKTLWSIESDRNLNTRPAIGSEAVFYGSESGYLQAYDKTNGEQLWEIQLPGIIKNPLTVAHGAVWAATRRGDLFAYDQTTGSQYLAKQFDSDSNFAILGDTLVVSSENQAYKITTP